MPAAKPPEFRRRAVDVARSGQQPVAKIASDLGISESHPQTTETGTLSRSPASRGLLISVLVEGRSELSSRTDTTLRHTAPIGAWKRRCPQPTHSARGAPHPKSRCRGLTPRLPRPGVCQFRERIGDDPVTVLSCVLIPHRG